MLSNVLLNLLLKDHFTFLLQLVDVANYIEQLPNIETVLCMPNKVNSNMVYRYAFMFISNMFEHFYIYISEIQYFVAFMFYITPSSVY